MQLFCYLREIIVRIRLFILGLLCLAACNSKENSVDPPKPAPKPDIPVPEEFADYVSVPVSLPEAKVQPMTGIVLWTDNEKAATDCIQLEYSYMRYCDVCSTKDKFNWTVVENLLDDVASRGHQAILRFYYVYPGEQTTVPAYIKALSGYEETKGTSEGEQTWFPDWRSEELQNFHLAFYQAFAQRYDSDPRLAFLETGFGLWAEYHIYDGPFILGTTFPSKEFQTRWLCAMGAFFSNLPWCISIDAADSDYSPFKKDNQLLEFRFGCFDDSFMCEEHSTENRPNWLFFGTERYKTSPMGGEFSYYTDYDQRHCLDKSGIHGRRFESEAARYHLSFIIGNDQPDYQSISRIKEASMLTGYIFRLRDFRVKAGVGAVALVENAGVAPIYRDAYVAVGTARSDYSLRNLMPGEQKWIPVASPDANGKSVPGIACSHLVAGQEITFSN